MSIFLNEEENDSRILTKQNLLLLLINGGRLGTGFVNPVV
jgi:hypothetical protein